MGRNDRTEWENQLCRAPMPALPWDKLPPLPPLPPITDSKLSKMVFTHTSLSNVSRLAHTSVQLLTGQAGADYEKLEHVGDAILEAIAVTMAHELYPNTRQGGATIIRSHLVSNATLAQIAVQYGLHTKINSEFSMRHNLKSNQKIQASIFEAYIAGLYYSYLGTDVAEEPEASELGEENRIEEGSESERDGESGDDVVPEGSGGDGAEKAEVQMMEDEKPGDGSRDDGDDQSDATDPVPADRAATSDNINSLVPKATPPPHRLLSPYPCTPAPAPSTDPVPSPSPPVNTPSTSAGSPIEPIPAHSLFTGSSNSDPPSQRASGPASLTKRRMRRGEAFELVFDWLSQVLTPICHFIVEVLVTEEDRLMALRPACLPKFETPAEWAEDDRRAVGGKGTLYQMMTKMGGEKPVYTEEPVESTHPSGLWKVTCSVVDWDGKQWQADTTRVSKHLASNVAAWKICVKMGIIREDE